MLSSCTPPRTAYFCTRACTNICFLNHINNNKEKLAWTTIFAWHVVWGIWVIPSPVSLQKKLSLLLHMGLHWSLFHRLFQEFPWAPPRMETPRFPRDLSQGCSPLQGKVCYPTSNLNPWAAIWGWGPSLHLLSLPRKVWLRLLCNRTDSTNNLEPEEG